MMFANGIALGSEAFLSPGPIASRWKIRIPGLYLVECMAIVYQLTDGVLDPSLGSELHTRLYFASELLVASPGEID